MEKGKAELAAGGQNLDEAKIQKVIFQGNTLTIAIYFVMILLNYILSK